MFLPNQVNPRKATTKDLDFDVAIIDDDVAESTEYFEVHFFVDSQAKSAGYAFPSSIARVTIFDDDGGIL